MLCVFDKLDEEIKIQDNVKFRSWQGGNTFFIGEGFIQNIDPFGNVYIDPDSELFIEGESYDVDATLIIVSTDLIHRDDGFIGVKKMKAYKEHKDRKNGRSFGFSWIEKIHKIL